MTLYLMVQILYSDFGNYGILKRDAYTLTSDSLFKKYKVEKWKDRLVVKQMVKIDRNRGAIISYVFNKIIWSIILVLCFMAMFMKLLYIRSGYYFVEHLILLILFNAKIFTILNVIYIIRLLNDTNEYIEMILLGIYVLGMIYLYMTMKEYYQQGWFKTLIKYLVTITLYMFVLGLSMLLVSLISAALF